MGPFLRAVLLAVLAAVLFSANIGGYDLWPPDEPRYAEVAREMRMSGDYLVPRVNGEPYKEKPPLLFWAIALVAEPFGGVSEVPARIPSVVAGVVTVLLAFALARRLFDERTAFWAALILMTCQRFWWQARFGQIDMLLTACLTAALYCFWRWQETRRLIWPAGFFLASVAGLYAKGPGVLVFPTLLMFAWTWPLPMRRRAWVQLGAGLVAAAALYAVWVVPARMAAAPEVHTAAGEAIASNLFRQTVGRFLLGVSHAQMPWYYFETLPVDWLPWTIFAPWTVYWTWKHRHDGPQMRLLLCWIVPAFVFFSIAIGKRAVYLMPLFPAMAMLVSASVLEFMESRHAMWRRRAAHVYAAMLLLLGAGPFILAATEYGSLSTAAMKFFGVLCLVLGAGVIMEARSTENTRLHTRIAASMAVVLAASAFAVFPAVNEHKSARAFCAPVRALAEAGAEFNLYSVGFAREEYIYYSKHFHEQIYTDLLILPSAAELSLRKQTELVKDLRGAIEDAVEDVDIAEIEDISPEELETLRAAIKAAIAEEEIDAQLVAEFEDALAVETDSFFEAFTSDVPAYLFVRAQDWRWIYAVHPDVRGARVIRHDQVGSREVLLVANPAGAALLEG